MYAKLGPFLFKIPTYSVEAIKRSVESRIAPQDIIGSKPITHLLGPGLESICLSSTFFPHHMNRGGPQMLSAVRMACEAQVPLMLVLGNGMVMHRWVIASVEETQSEIGFDGTPWKHEVEMTLTEYVDFGTGYGRSF